MLLELESCLIAIVPLLVTDDEYRQAFDCLDMEERIRAERFATGQLRRRFVVCRGRLRMLLGAILDTSASEIAFEYGSLGKPYLRSNVELHFNVSHSQDIALMAFSRSSPVGVDIEYFDRRMNDEAIARQLLSEAEFDAWNGLPKETQRQSLLSSWVAKEAILKSLGLGITTSLKKIALPIPIPREGFSPTFDPELTSKAQSIHPTKSSVRFCANGWTLRFIDEIPNAIAAVCYNIPRIAFNVKRWSMLINVLVFVMCVDDLAKWRTERPLRPSLLVPERLR